MKTKLLILMATVVLTVMIAGCGLAGCWTNSCYRDTYPTVTPWPTTVQERHQVIEPVLP